MMKNKQKISTAAETANQKATIKRNPSEIRDKIMEGLKLSYERLVEEKRKKGQYLIVYRNGKNVKIKP